MRLHFSTQQRIAYPFSGKQPQWLFTFTQLYIHIQAVKNIRTFYSLLEQWNTLFEQFTCLLEERDLILELLEHLLEHSYYIRTFSNLLENSQHILENY